MIEEEEEEERKKVGVCGGNTSNCFTQVYVYVYADVEGVLYGVEHSMVSSLVIGGLGVVLTPAGRRLVWKMTFGRYQSPEAAAQAASASLVAMRNSLEAQQGEIKKLSERLTMAQEEYARGLAKLRGAASEMRNLESRTQCSMRKAQGGCLSGYVGFFPARRAYSWYPCCFRYSLRYQEFARAASSSNAIRCRSCVGIGKAPVESGGEDCVQTGEAWALTADWIQSEKSPSCRM